MKSVVEANDFFSTWLMAEAADHDAIKVKRVYIDINEGNLIDGVLFSQIMYWHGINRETGKPRMSIVKDNHLWLAREYSEWYEECRVNYESARASIGRMVKRGLLVKKVYRFNGMATVHIRIDPAAFETAIKAAQNKPSETAINRKPRKSTKSSPVCDTVPIRSGIQSQSGLVSNRKPLTETTAQTTAEITLSQPANAVATDALGSEIDETPIPAKSQALIDAVKEKSAVTNLQLAGQPAAGAPEVAAKAVEPEAKRESTDAVKDKVLTERKKPKEHKPPDPVFRWVCDYLGVNPDVAWNSSKHEAWGMRGYIIAEEKGRLKQTTPLTDDQLADAAKRLPGFPMWYEKECKDCSLPRYRRFQTWIGKWYLAGRPGNPNENKWTYDANTGQWKEPTHAK